MSGTTEREGLGAAAVAAVLILGPTIAAYPLQALGAAIAAALAWVLVSMWQD